MNNYLLIAIALTTAFSCHAEKENIVVDCSSVAHSNMQIGQLKNFNLGEELTQIEVLQTELNTLIKNAQILARIEPLPSEREGIIEESLEILEGRTNKPYSCLFSRAGVESKIHKFTESEGSETRYGYIVIRKEVKVGYFYTSIVNI